MFSNYVHFLRIQSIFTNNHHKIPQKIIIKKKGVRTESKGGVVEGAWKEKKKNLEVKGRVQIEFENEDGRVGEKREWES